MSAALLAVAALVVVPVGTANISAGLGVTAQGEPTGRVGLVREWERRWWESARGYLTGYWDGAYTYWGSSDEVGGAHSLSFSPVLVYQFDRPRLRPFIEFGIGVSLFSRTRVGERRLGSSFNFEDRLGAGITLPSGSRIGVRVIHYSNADIKQPNMGIDSFSVFYTRSY